MSNIPVADLGSILPAKVRRGVYVTYGLLALTVASTQIGFAAVPGGDQPVWLTVTLAVTAFLSTPVMALAASNTPAPPAELARGGVVRSPARRG